LSDDGGWAGGWLEPGQTRVDWAGIRKSHATMVGTRQGATLE